MNTYIIKAESYHIINEEVKKIILDNSFISYNLNKSTIKDIIEEASYVSLDNSTKYIVVSNAPLSKLNEEDNNLLLNYINKNNSNSVLIFTTMEDIDNRKKIIKEIKAKGTLIDYKKMDYKSINSYLTSYVKKNGYNIDYNTISYIMNNSYNNLDIMINELDKIMLYYSNPCSIKYSDVTSIIKEEIDSNNFHFVNAVIDGDLQSSLKLLKDLFVYKTDPSSLIILLAREYRLMYYVKNNYQNSLGLADWQINKLYMNASKYSNKELLANLVKLSKIDIDIKKGILDKDTALYNFILDVC